MNKKDLGVRVVYRGKDLKPVYTLRYSLTEYTEMLRNDLQCLVTDIENMCIDAAGGKPKSEWNDRMWVAFNAIKHKLLDKAGDIGRLPSNLYERSEEAWQESSGTGGKTS